MCAALLALCVAACDDNTDFIGSSVVSGPDYIKAGVATFFPLSSTVKADTVYTRSSTAYLGKYTHPDFGSFESSFMAQFNVTEKYEIPGFENFVSDDNSGLTEPPYDRSISPKRVYVAGLYTSYFGDSTAVGTLDVYELNKDLYNSDDIYYSNVNPSDFYSTSDFLGSVSYAPTDLSIPATTREDNYQYVIVDLPISKGKEIIQLYQNCKKNGLSFRSNFLQQFKGIYAQQVQGDGAMLYLDQVRLSFDMDEYVIDEETGRPYRTDAGIEDSTVTTSFSFSTTKEIVQVNKFRNNTPDSFLNNDTCSYIKSPAGLFTRVSIPLKAIADSIIAQGDSLTAVSIAFTADSLYDISGITPPTNLLMVRDTATINGVFNNYQKDFFADNNVPDKRTSFVASISSYTYKFSDIRKLIAAVIEEYGGTDRVPEYLNVLLIPVEITYDSSTIIGMNNYLKPSYVRLHGGEKDPEARRLKMEVYYSVFQ